MPAPFEVGNDRPRQWLNTIPGSRGTSLFIGLDLGQSRNHTALVTLKRSWVAATPDQFLISAGRAVTGYWAHDIIHADRLPLGASYLDVAHWVKDHLDSFIEPGSKNLVLDATGVGSAVRDCFLGMRLKANLIAVTITGSNAAGYSYGPFGVSTSRVEVLTNLVATIEQERFTVNRRCRARPALFNELLSLRRRGKPNATEDSQGQDDLAFALALAVWWATK